MLNFKRHTRGAAVQLTAMCTATDRCRWHV